ncbi:MAG: saccharopine dehydrogenase NADP-binding domain-containing protein, partial [Thermoplasmata archaeon]|nr:saccharopine dehydrogenase NADP-binding domain-containing protein [Thermoplasmata archaeon]
MKAMVLGTGAVGSVTAEILGHAEEFDKVILADVNLERARRAEKKIASDKVTVQKVDASDVDNLTESIKGIDLVLNAVIPRFNMNIMQACLRAKANYSDMAWDVAVDKTKPGEIIKETPAMQYIKLDAEYKKAGIVGMMGLGCDPGLSNIFARMAANRMDKVKQILVRDGDNGAVAGHHFAP